MSAFLKAMSQIDWEASFVIDPNHDLKDDTEIELLKARIWRWADEHFEHAWTKAHERFREAVSSPLPAVVERETSIYRDAICDFIRRYRQAKQTNQVSATLERIRARQAQRPEEQTELNLNDTPTPTR